jgi:uncharacterized protein YkwD
MAGDPDVALQAAILSLVVLYRISRSMKPHALVLALSVIVLAACASKQERPQPATESSPASSAAPARPAPGGPTRVSVNAIEQSVIEATNAFRTQSGLPALKPTVKLLIVAQNHARNMARQDKFGDTDKNGHVLDGQNVEYRIKVSGYAFSHIAENVGYQLHRPDPAAAMMEGWKNSPGHRKNMLLPDITELGVGAAQGKSGRWYFVQVFGRPPEQPRKQALGATRRATSV